jgi:hypothetical protein
MGKDKRVRRGKVSCRLAPMMWPQHKWVAGIVLWLSVSGALVSIAWYLYTNQAWLIEMIGPRTTGFAIGTICIVGFLYAMSLIAAGDRSPNIHGPLVVHMTPFRVDYQNGIRNDGIIWQKGYSRTDLIFQNPLGEVILDLDVTIRPEFPIIKSAVMSDFATCQLGPLRPVARPIVVGNGNLVSSDDTPADDDIPHRLYCDKLASKTLIRVILATVVSGRNPVMGPMFEPTRNDPRYVDFFVKYHVGTIKYDEKFRLTFSTPPK